MTEQVTAADYEQLVRPVEPAVSPDGDRVAYVRRVPDDDEGYERTVYVASDDGDRRFTLREGGDSDPQFSPSGDRLAFTSTRGADDDTRQLWVVPTDGGEARQVTNVVGGVASVAWGPDGDRVAFLQQVTDEDREADRDLSRPAEYEPDQPDPRVIDRTVYRSAERYFDGRRTEVYVADLTEAEPEDAVSRITDGGDDHGSVSWGGTTTLYYTRSVGEDPDDSTAYEIVAYDTVEGTETTLYQTTGIEAGMTATADGRIAHLYSPEEQSSIQQTDVHVYDRESDTVRDLTGELDRTVGYAGVPHWDAEEEAVLFTTADEGGNAVWRVPADASEAPERHYRGTSLDGFAVDGGRIAVVESEWDHPGDVFLLDTDGTTQTAGGSADAGVERERLTRVNESYLSDVTVSEPEPITYESEQGDVDGWVLRPPEFDPEETYPLAVEVHGGPHAMWTTSGTMWHEFQTLAARGYVVFWSNPRGSTGYGAEYMQAIERDWGAVTAEDVLAGVDLVTDREYVDETNVFLTGGSFGGYMTGWLVGTTDRFAAAVAQRGVFDLTGFYGSTDFAYRLVEGDYDTTPWEEPDFLWEQSPVGHAHEVDTPTLVVHSDNDYRTPANTAELFHRILRKHGVDTRLVRYPDEGHELSRSGEPDRVVDRIERIARWFDGYSEHHDADRALDRPDDDGLSADEDDE